MGFKRKFYILIRKSVYNLINFINTITRKSEKKIFIYDEFLRRDNMWVVLNYIIKTKLNESYKIVYFSKVDISEKNTTNIIFTTNNIRGLYHQVTSKFVFWGYGTYRFTCKPKNGQIIINLWHGSPLKNIGYLTDKPWYRYEDTFSYILCASDFFKDILKKCFNCKDEQLFICGGPRNDLLYINNSLEKLNINKTKYNNIVLWMPTFRQSNDKRCNDSNVEFPILNSKNICNLNKYLAEKNILTIIKPHPYQAQIDFLKVKHSNIRVLTNAELQGKDIQLYELLGEADTLLTDFSSVYFDFLITQNPIGFVFDDLSEYKDKRGFTVENPLELMPGEKIYNYEELIKFLEDIMNGKDKYKEERNRVNNLANEYQDGNNCRRLLKFLNIN